MTFISLLIVCSASWIIKDFTDQYFKWSEWETTDNAEMNTYINSVQVDTLAEYFTAGDTLDGGSGKYYYTYDGTSKEPVLTLDGAKALYGDQQGNLSDADFLSKMNAPGTRPYTVQWEAGEFYNSTLNSKMFSDAYKEYRGVIAGTHYYRIVDNETRSVISYKHAVDIRQDELVNAELKASRPYVVGETISAPEVKWTTKNTQNKQFYTATLNDFTVTEDLFVGTARLSTPTPLSTTTASLGIMTNGGSVAERIRDVFKNNYSNAETATATFGYDIIATCYQGSNYYPTICRALEATKNATSAVTVYAEPIIKYGNFTYTAAHTPASGEVAFTHHICHDSTIGSKVTLSVAIPKDDGSINTSTDATKYYIEKTYTNAYQAPDTYCKSIVELSATLTVNGKLFVGGIFNAGGGGYKSGQVCGNYAQINVIDAPDESDGGKISAESGSTVTCMGFITEAKTKDGASDNAEDIQFKNGATLLMPFILYEFRGGTVSTGMQKADDSFYAAPFHRFAFANIDAAYTVHGGATANAIAALYASSMSADATASVISKNTSGTLPLVTLPEGSRMEINYKSEEMIDTLCGKMYLKFYGGATLNMLKIEKRVLITTITVSTNGAYMPIPYLYDIELHDGSYNMGSQKVKVYPGGKIFVAEDATLKASSLILYDSLPPIGTQGSSAGSTPFPTESLSPGRLVIAGHVEVGSFGGKAEIASASASLKLTSSASVTDSYELSNSGVTTDYKFGDYYYDRITADASGLVSEYGTTVSKNLKVEEYTAYDSDDRENVEKLAWRYQSDISIYYYDENGARAKLLTQTDVWSSDGFVLTSEQLPDPPPGTHYTFGGWYLDAACTQPLSEKLVYEDVQIYAKWIAKVYTATIYNVYPGNAPSVRSTVSFTIEETISTPQSMSGGNFNFGGWYLDAACTDANRYKSETISGRDLYANGSKLYIKWIAEKTYTITFKSDHHADIFGGVSTVTETQISDGTSINAIKPYATDYRSDYREDYYFSHWEYNGVKVTNLNEFMPADENPTLTAVWVKKSSITFKSATSLKAYAGDLIPYYDAPVYYVTGDITLPNLKANDAASKTNLYYFVSWDLSGATPGATYNLNGDITVTVTWGYKYLVQITTTNNETVSGITSGMYYPGPSVTGISVSHASGYKNATLSVTGSSGATYSGGTLTFPAQTSGHITVALLANSESCIASGTLITLADGTQKKVEDLLETDILLVFDHETGRFIEAPIVFIERDGWSEYNVINLKFSDGRITRLIYEHGLFDLTLNKYVYITEENCTEFIGHEFAVIDGDTWSTVTLTEAYVTTEYVGCYSLVTAYHLNYFIDGLFSMPGGIEGLFNIFEYGEDLVYDAEQMQKDIETYGLYTYEEFAEYIPEEVFYAFPTVYLKVAIGKGYLTFDDILGMIERYVVGNGLM